MQKNIKGIFTLLVILTVFAMCLPKAMAQPVHVAEVVHVEGEVRVKSATIKEWVNAEPGMKVKEGDIVKTGVDSRAELAFGEKLKNIISVFANSQLIVAKLNPGVINLTDGRVFTLIEKLDKGSTFEVRTPTAVAGAKGTGWETALSGRQKNTIVKGYARKVYIAGLDKKGNLIGKRDLDKGFKSIIERGKRPGLAKRLSRHEKRQWKKWKGSAKKRVKKFKKRKPQEVKPTAEVKKTKTMKQKIRTAEQKARDAEKKLRPIERKPIIINKVNRRLEKVNTIRKNNAADSSDNTSRSLRQD